MYLYDKSSTLRALLCRTGYVLRFGPADASGKIVVAGSTRQREENNLGCNGLYKPLQLWPEQRRLHGQSTVGSVNKISDSIPANRRHFIAETGSIGIPRPVYHNRRPNDIFHRDKTPVPTVETVVAVIA